MHVPINHGSGSLHNNAVYYRMLSLGPLLSPNRRDHVRHECGTPNLRETCDLSSYPRILRLGFPLYNVVYWDVLVRTLSDGSMLWDTMYCIPNDFTEFITVEAVDSLTKWYFLLRLRLLHCPRGGSLGESGGVSLWCSMCASLGIEGVSRGQVPVPERPLPPESLFLSLPLY